MTAQGEIWNQAGLRSRRTWVSLVLCVLSALVLLLVNYKYFHATYDERDAERFGQTLQDKQDLIHDKFSSLIGQFRESNPLEVLDEHSAEFRNLSEEEGIYFFFYEGDRLAYWSDHSVPIRPRWNRTLEQPVLILPNATYVAVKQHTDTGIMLGLILVRTTYTYENDYLVNKYQEDFRIRADIPLQVGSEGDGAPVKSKNGTILFKLDFQDSLKRQNSNILVALFCGLIFMVSLFMFLFWKIQAGQTASRRAAWLMAAIAALSLVTLLFSFYEIPPVIFESTLFSPEIFASQLFPSLGVLLVWVLYFFFLGVLVIAFFDRSHSIPGRFYPLLIVLFTALGTISLLLVQRLLAHLVLDSSISFEAYNLSTLSIHTFLGLIILVLGMLVYCFFILKALGYGESQLRLRFYIFLAAGILAGQVPFIILHGAPTDLMTLVYLVVFTSMIIYLRQLARNRLRMSSFFLPLLIFSLYTSAELQKYNTLKTENEKEIELAKLSSQHDVVAEMLFREISREINADSVLKQSLVFPYFDFEFVTDYIQREYFSGYWTKYDMQILVCRPSDSVFVEPPVEEWYHCYSFFDEILQGDGVRIPETNFYFLDNLNGRISYLAVFVFDMNDGEVSLFLELDSKIISEELGYPELLLSEDTQSDNKYDYAIYNRGQLITSQGDFNYRRNSDFYTSKENTFEMFRSEGYNHSILNIDEENMVIVSSPAVSFVDRLISFSYIFAFYFLVFSLTWMFLSVPGFRKSLDWDFKNKIQYSMIGLLFLTFVFICGGTIYFIVQQYRDKHHNNLENTMRSLYIELIHKVEFEEDLRNWSSESYNNLDELLRKFSNVFYTDINMYDERGVLLATSRSEIFNQRLLSLRMNRVAYEKLAIENYSAYIHTERVGKLKFQSAYVPLLNSENHLLAYLNLPYFTQPGVLTQEVLNLVVAIVNIYVILLLTIIFLSVFLADRITQPLRVIQSRIAQLSLGKQNEKIQYSGQDEIRGLVEEYNYMVDELQKSAELLAMSERESAWREMAKQIAHEIKNPLTPMKLNLQHLDRLVTQDTENLEEQIRKVIHTLVEQIDSLTSIANEFSDFAKMPRAKNRKVDLVAKIRNTTRLFQNTQSETVEVEIAPDQQFHVYGDPEQIQRVIINLVKNGIQSVPEGRKAQIELKLERTEDNFALLSVKDNGKGIPEEIRDKLFQPNFTTKSSGMGMGLAISASIVRAMRGEIWYESALGEGTVFHVMLPLDKE